MRKIWWGCAAAGAAAVGVGCLAVQYACDHPNSWAGHGFTGIQAAVLTEADTLRATRQTAEVALRSAQGFLGTAGPATVWDKPDSCPVSESTPAACPGRMHAAILPGSVVIQDEEADGVLPLQAMPAVPDVAAGMPLSGSIEECNEAPMPRVEDEAAKMPACPEDGDGPFSWVKSSLPMMPRDGGERPRQRKADTLEIRPGDLLFLDWIGPF